MLSPLSADETTRRARQVLESGRGTGLPELLELIKCLTTGITDATISEIAELIEQDATVVTRLLAIANTIFHNPRVEPLSSLSHAIHAVGFQRIRSLAVSLMLIENSTRAGSAPEQRAAATHAFCCGLLAQGCAKSLGGLDSESAFACAALRQLGHILLPAVSVEHCRTAQRRLHHGPEREDTVYRSLFGLSPLEVSRTLLSTARLPEEVLRGLHEVHAGSRPGPGDSSRLAAIADFANHLATLTLDPHLKSADFHREALRLSRQYHHALPAAADLVLPSLEHTSDCLATYTRLGISLTLSKSVNIRLRALIPSDTGEAPRPNSSTEDASEADPPPTTTASPPAPTAASEEPPLRAARDPKPAQPTLSSVLDELAADYVWLFAPAVSGPSLFLAHTIGPWPGLATPPRIRDDERSVFGVCLARRQAVTIHDTRAASLQPHLPAWFTRCEPLPRAVLLVPLPAPARGLTLIGWKTTRTTFPSAQQVALVCQLLTGTAAKS